MMYRISFTRPYLSHPRCDEIQRSVLIAQDEQQVRDIYADCEVLAVEAMPDYEMEYQMALAARYAAEQMIHNETVNMVAQLTIAIYGMCGSDITLAAQLREAGFGEDGRF